MQAINWLDLQPLPADLEALRARLQEALPMRDLSQWLVETTLRAYPWTGRADLIPCYHPSQTYQQGQRLVLLISDPQNIHQIFWLLAQVKDTKIVENPIQGRFQVLTLDAHGRQIQLAGGISEASYPEPDLASYSDEELAWLVAWLSDTYAAPLQATLRKLIQEGQIRGRLAGQTFLPERVSALSPQLLHPFFARLSPDRPWVSLEEITKGLPDLSQLEPETASGLIRAALKESPYRSLGADRWTTPELFDQFNRDVPRGLSTLELHSKVHTWTKRDEQDLAGYGRKVLPTEARQALEELEAGENLLEGDDSPWRPPKAPVRLPALNYLHMTQACFPVGHILPAFAPDVQLVFFKFIDGKHQPFLLDRENGLLKALHPEALRSKILADGIPAGTHLWLEYEGSEKYRIAPRRLPFKRMVPCKLAQIENGKIHIQQIQISMMYQGNPFLFKADLRSEEIEALFAEAGRAKLNLLDSMIYAVQEICGTDPDHRAHWLDIFNAVFLQRTCSPASIAFLLYTQPCFEPLAGGYFRYQPAPPPPVRKLRKRTDRLAQLWEGLLSDPVPPKPSAQKSMSAGPRSMPAALAPGPEPTSLLRQLEPEISAQALPVVVVEEEALTKTALKEETRLESFRVSSGEPDGFTPPQLDADEPVNQPWRDSLKTLFHSLVELQDPEHSALPAEEANPAMETISGLPAEASSEGSVPYSSPFHWEPKPAWINVSIQPKPLIRDTTNMRRPVYGPKIPVRPLHKRPFYQRLFFYLTRIFRKTT